MNTIYNSPLQDNETCTYPVFVFRILVDIALGIIGGLVVNIFADYISNMFNLNGFARLFIQFILITLVLYIIKLNGRHLTATWQGEGSFGIIFLTVFLIIQKNFVKFLENIYIEEERRIGIKELGAI